MTKCSVDGCEKPARWGGMCQMHRQRFNKHGTTNPVKGSHGTLEQRFWQYVAKRGPDECWEWTGYRYPQGYGRIQEAGKGSRGLLAHRVSYELRYGSIPDTGVVMHSCDNPCCVNPAHLSVGTLQDNNADRDIKGRHRPGVCLGGVNNGKAKLTPDLVRYIRASPLNNAELSRELGVSINAVRGVRIGRTWSHVA